jgi:UDP-N-acetyl-2-amino-2-deoxyglucuronate dehydrogenase
LKNDIAINEDVADVYLKYITPRGLWYDYSWKGIIDKSGGILFNIGIHFFDMLIWVFGKPINYSVTNLKKKSYGNLQLEKANIKFELSIDYNDLPHKEWKPHRIISIDGNELEFSEGFTELHNTSYENIIKNKGYGINDVFDAIELIEKMSK